MGALLFFQDGKESFLITVFSIDPALFPHHQIYLHFQAVFGCGKGLLQKLFFNTF